MSATTIRPFVQGDQGQFSGWCVVVSIDGREYEVGWYDTREEAESNAARDERAALDQVAWMAQGGDGPSDQELTSWLLRNDPGTLGL